MRKKMATPGGKGSLTPDVPQWDVAQDLCSEPQLRRKIVHARPVKIRQPSATTVIGTTESIRS